MKAVFFASRNSPRQKSDYNPSFRKEIEGDNNYYHLKY